MRGIFISTLLLGLIVPVFVSAEVKITEIMYDLPGTDTDREWVEIFNNGSDSVTITSDFRFVTNGINHTLTTKDNPISVPGGAYAVLVDDPAGFAVDWPSVSGLVIDSSFSLNNTAGDLQLKDGDGNILASVSYTSDQGGAGDGNSLQQNGGTWIAAEPTPLATNATEGTTPPADDDDDNNNGTTTASTTPPTTSGGGSSGGSTSGSTHSCPVADKNPDANYVFTVAAGRKRHTAAGSEVIFDATPKLRSNSSGSKIDYRWSFGDGVIASGKRVVHTYSFPGDYVVVLNARQGNEEAVSRTEVRVDKPEVMISRIERATGLIEITDQASAEINLGGWRIKAGDKVFVFPIDTIVKPKGSISLVPAVTGFTPPIEGATLFAPDNQTVAQAGRNIVAMAALPIDPNEPDEYELAALPTVSIEAITTLVEDPEVAPTKDLGQATTSLGAVLPAALPIIIEKTPGPLSRVVGSVKSLFNGILR